MSEKKQVLYIRILVVVFIAISAILALIQYKSSVTFIAQLMGISWGALAGSFLAPFMFSLYSKKVSKASCWACFYSAQYLCLLTSSSEQASQHGSSHLSTAVHLQCLPE